jgi:alkylated DNA repair dioxygenase AlkB
MEKKKILQSVDPVTEQTEKITVYYSPTDAQMTVLKTILKFTLKQLRHVSVQSQHLQGAHYPCLLKLQLLK